MILTECISFCVKPFWTARSFPFCRSLSCFTTTHTRSMTDTPGRHTFSRCGTFSFDGSQWFSGEVEHFVHLIRWNLNSCLCPCGVTWLRSRSGVTHDFCCSWNWVLLRLIVLVDSRPSPTSPHSVPNSSPVLLRNVSWGLGVCSVFVRSVSPRRLVLEVRSFPSPPALFWPFARRLCPLFPSSCLSGLTWLRPGVCV